MIKIITFTGRPGSYSDDKLSGQGADDKYNRWMRSHQGCHIRDIDTSIDNNGYQYITVIYTEPEGAIDQFVTLEDSWYMINFDTGAFIECKTSVNLSYMLKDIESLRVDINKFLICTEVVLEVEGDRFILHYNTSSLVRQPHRNPELKPHAAWTEFNAIKYIHEEFLQSYPTKAAASKPFRLSENYGKYTFDRKSLTLIKDENRLNVTYILTSPITFDRYVSMCNDVVELICDQQGFMYTDINSSEPIVIPYRDESGVDLVNRRYL